MAKKELEYYNSEITSNEPDERTKQRRYLEVLGNAHTKMWVEVSRIDWMIADSQKRIEQLRSVGKDGKVKWLPSVSGTAASTELQSSQFLTEGLHKMSLVHKERVEKMRSETYRSLENLETAEELGSQKIFDRETGEMKPLVSVAL